MLASQLSEELADLILSGSLELGAPLEEQALADKFGVSRTPVREALRRLASSGLVELRPRRPAIVRRLSSEELADLLEALGEIEGLCARYAAERMTQGERLLLKSLLEKSADALPDKDSASIRRYDAELHRLIHQGSHNRSLQKVARDMRSQASVYSSAPYTMPNHVSDPSVPHRQHEGIVRAILAHDADEAQRLMGEHIGSTLLTIQQLIGKSQTASRQGRLKHAAGMARP